MAVKSGSLKSIKSDKSDKSDGGSKSGMDFQHILARLLFFVVGFLNIECHIINVNFLKRIQLVMEID